MYLITYLILHKNLFWLAFAKEPIDTDLRSKIAKRMFIRREVKPVGGYAAGNDNPASAQMGARRSSGMESMWGSSGGFVANRQRTPRLARRRAPYNAGAEPDLSIVLTTPRKAEPEEAPAAKDRPLHHSPRKQGCTLQPPAYLNLRSPEQLPSFPSSVAIARQPASS